MTESRRNINVQIHSYCNNCPLHINVIAQAVSQTNTFLSFSHQIGSRLGFFLFPARPAGTQKNSGVPSSHSFNLPYLDKQKQCLDVKVLGCFCKKDSFCQIAF